MWTSMATLNHKQNSPEIKPWRPLVKAFDEDEYHTKVLQLPIALTEDEVDERIARDAEAMGLLLPQISSEIEEITSSLSGATFHSEPLETSIQSSDRSQSTAPTSCSSSECRPMTHSSIKSVDCDAVSQTPSTMISGMDKKHGTFRNGFRKMAGFKKRRSVGLSSSTLISINSDSATTQESDGMSVKSDLKSPASIKSSKSSWSSPMSVTKSSYEHPVRIDHEALKRSMECKEMLRLRTTQLEERARFLEYQNSFISELKRHRDIIKAEKREKMHKIIEEQERKNDKAVEELEARQLEDEMKMLQDHDHEKRSVMVRLRHMEAYCQNPTPPPAPVENHVSGRRPIESVLPERKVTEKDYLNLAQQYRERDTMENLHASKINVLRGKQKKSLENFICKKEREVSQTENEHQRELDQVDMEYAGHEGNLRMTFSNKRDRLETRWRTQALIERTRIEKITGLRYGALPDVTAAEDSRNVLLEIS